jgi:signal transduction histidine kinase
VDALDELHVVGRQLYLFDSVGTPLKPADAPSWIRDAARAAAARGTADLSHEEPGDEGQTTRVHAQRFRLASGQPAVAVATMDDVEFEDRYGDLIAAFGAAAVGAAVCVAIGAWLLVRQSTRPIERSVTRMRQFMADAAHELRTPLTIVRSRAEVALQQPRAADDYVGALHSIEREATRLGGIVDDLLLLARAESGELPLRRERVYLDDIALDAAHAALPIAQRAGITLAVPTFEETPIVADGELVRQLVMILLDNALKFTPDGGTVTVAVSDGAGQAELSVADTGPGIPSEQLPQVFERFFRGDEARGRANGAGLGLSIARWIAEQHDATIHIESQIGAGTRVIVRFNEAAAPARGTRA